MLILLFADLLMHGKQKILNLEVHFFHKCDQLMMKLCLNIFVLFHCIYFSHASNINPGNQKIEKFVGEQGFFQNTISSITSDNLGYLWIATPNGLVRYDGYSFEYYYHVYSYPESIPGNKISSLLNDSDGKLWIGTDQGLCLYLTDKEQFVTLNIDLKGSTFLKEDTQNKVWVGKGSNLYVFPIKLTVPKIQKQTQLINLSKELEGENIVDIEFVEDSVCFLATLSSVYKVSYNAARNYEYKIQKLVLDYEGNGISSIIKRDNSLWIGTDNGIYQTLPEHNRLITIRHFLVQVMVNAIIHLECLPCFLIRTTIYGLVQNEMAY